MTQEEQLILIEAGWGENSLTWQTCRVCHETILGYAWNSPGGKSYHESCLNGSSLAVKTVKGKQS